jgi:hypothetical protein
MQARRNPSQSGSMRCSTHNEDDDGSASKSKEREHTSCEGEADGSSTNMQGKASWSPRGKASRKLQHRDHDMIDIIMINVSRGMTPSTHDHAESYWQANEYR